MFIIRTRCNLAISSCNSETWSSRSLRLLSTSFKHIDSVETLFSCWLNFNLVSSSVFVFNSKLLWKLVLSPSSFSHLSTNVETSDLTFETSNLAAVNSSSILLNSSFPEWSVDDYLDKQCENPTLLESFCYLHYFLVLLQNHSNDVKGQNLSFLGSLYWRFWPCLKLRYDHFDERFLRFMTNLLKLKKPGFCLIKMMISQLPTRLEPSMITPLKAEILFYPVVSLVLRFDPKITK